MRIGQNVRIISVPESVVDAPGFPTRSIMIQCIGKVFPIMGFQGELLAIDVGGVSGKASYLETIYVEPECVEEVSNTSGAPTPATSCKTVISET